MARNSIHSNYSRPIKKLNIGISAIAGIMFFLAIILAIFGYYKVPASSHMDTQGGMSGLGNIFIFIPHLIINSIVLLASIVTLLIVAIKREQLRDIYTIINFILLALFLCLPFELFLIM